MVGTTSAMWAMWRLSHENCFTPRIIGLNSKEMKKLNVPFFLRQSYFHLWILMRGIHSFKKKKPTLCCDCFSFSSFTSSPFLQYFYCLSAKSGKFLHTFHWCFNYFCMSVCASGRKMKRSFTLCKLCCSVCFLCAHQLNGSAYMCTSQKVIPLIHTNPKWP